MYHRRPWQHGLTDFNAMSHSYVRSAKPQQQQQQQLQQQQQQFEDEQQQQQQESLAVQGAVDALVRELPGDIFNAPLGAEDDELERMLRNDGVKEDTVADDPFM